MIMTHAVIKQVQKDFHIDDQASVLEYLSLYGSQEFEIEEERVRLAILKLSSGSKTQVLHFVTEAKKDYRDVLFWAEN